MADGGWTLVIAAAFRVPQLENTKKRRAALESNMRLRLESTQVITYKTTKWERVEMEILLGKPKILSGKGMEMAALLCYKTTK